MKQMKNTVVCPDARITHRLDTAVELAVSVRALSVRITVPEA